MEILNTTGFTDAVAQDDLEQVSSALENVPPHLWARILDSCGACQALEWENLPELTEVLLKNSVAVELWSKVLNRSTLDVYDAVFNERVAQYVEMYSKPVLT
jgi:hypothetical protein